MVLKLIKPDAKRITRRPKLSKQSQMRQLTARYAAEAASREKHNHFKLFKPMPGVLPAGANIAMDFDDTLAGVLDFGYQNGYGEGLGFMGYSVLSELMQRPEYRRFAEIFAEEMTRKFIRIISASDEDQSFRIKLINDALDKFKLKDIFYQLAFIDCAYGRAMLYIDTGELSDAEARSPLIISKETIPLHSLVGFKAIEPMWSYPTGFNSMDPTRDDFYKPRAWYSMGKEYHASRMVPFIGRDVPDMLKPVYQFGGLSLTQMVKPYVDNWIRTRQNVGDAIEQFAQNVLKTNLESVLEGGGGEDLDARVALYNAVRSARGTMVIDKDTEDFMIASMPLGNLDKLQAQAQEQMCSVVALPLIKYLGITPSGLNASTDNELRVLFDTIAGKQALLYGPHMKMILDIIMQSELGEVNKDISYTFEALWQMSDTERATMRSTNANTAKTYIDAGVVDAEEERRRLANEEDGMYPGLDPDDLPEPPQQPGMDPFGGVGGPDDPEPGPDDAGGGQPTDPKPPVKAKTPVVAADAEWHEDEHKRATDGKFGEGGSAPKHDEVVTAALAKLKAVSEAGGSVWPAKLSGAEKVALHPLRSQYNYSWDEMYKAEIGGDPAAAAKQKAQAAVPAKKATPAKTTVIEKSKFPHAWEPGEHAAIGSGWQKNFADLATLKPSNTHAYYDRMEEFARAQLSEMPIEQQQAMNDYYEGGYASYNALLRKGKKPDPQTKAEIDHIQSAIENSVLPMDATVMRGMKMTPSVAAAVFGGKFDQELIGKTFQPKGFFSTSTSENKAAEYASSMGTEAKGKPVFITIKMKAGTKGAMVAPNFSAEKEITLPHHSQFKILKVDHGSDQTELVCEYLGSGKSIAQDAEFKEDDHKRDEGGKFAASASSGLKAELHPDKFASDVTKKQLSFMHDHVELAHKLDGDAKKTALKTIRSVTPSRYGAKVHKYLDQLIEEHGASEHEADGSVTLKTLSSWLQEQKGKGVSVPKEVEKIVAEEPKVEVNHLASSQSDYEKAVYDEIQNRLDSGEKVYSSTSTKTAEIGPKNRDAIRLENGKLEIAQGNKWIRLSGQSLDTLAGRLGFPTSYDRHKYEYDNTDHDAVEQQLKIHAKTLGPLIAEAEAARVASIANVDDRNADKYHSETLVKLKAEAKKLGVNNYDLKDMMDSFEPSEEPKADILVLADQLKVPSYVKSGPEMKYGQFGWTSDETISQAHKNLSNSGFVRKGEDSKFVGSYRPGNLDVTVKTKSTSQEYTHPDGYTATLRSEKSGSKNPRVYYHIIKNKELNLK